MRDAGRLKALATFADDSALVPTLMLYLSKPPVTLVLDSPSSGLHRHLHTCDVHTDKHTCAYTCK